MIDYFANNDPFETGRFEKNYTNVRKIKEIVRFSRESKCNNQDVIMILGPYVNHDRIYVFCTKYCGVNSVGREVQITKYERKLSRKITETTYEADSKGTVAKCGADFLSAINLVLRRYPFDKNFNYWIELLLDESVDDIPLLVLYVEHKSDQLPIDGYFKQYHLSYMTRRQILVKTICKAHTLLRYDLLHELCTSTEKLESRFFIEIIRERPNDEGMISCVPSTTELFGFILEYFIDCKNDYKTRMLKKLEKNWQSVQKSFCNALQRCLTDMFEVDSSLADPLSALPVEMCMLFWRLKSEKGILIGNNFNKLMEEFQFPYEQSRLECFEKLEVLGSGSFGDVHLARHNGSGAKYAIKVIKNYNQTQKTTNKLLSSLLLANKFVHKNVVKTFDAWTSNYHSGWITYISFADTNTQTSSNVYGDRTCDYCTAVTHLQASTETEGSNANDWNCEHRYTFIVLQACQNSLFSLMKEKNLAETQIIRYMKELLQGLEYLNRLGFMHRDVKPQNALISENGSLLIADLDTVKRIKQKNDGELIRNTLIRTPAYVSPEMNSTNYDERTDYYSIGITIAQMMCPEVWGDMKGFLDLIHKDQLPQILHPQYAYIIRWLTEEDPTDRVGPLCFSRMSSLLGRFRYINWSLRFSNSYSAVIEHEFTGEIMQCLRVIDSKNAIREVVRRYSRDSSYKRFKYLLRRHSDRQKYPRKYKLRLEPAAAFERNYQLTDAKKEQRCIELVDGKLVPVISDKTYTYICYTVVLSKESSPQNSVRFISELLVPQSLEFFTRWGAYCFASFTRCPFYPDNFIIEPFMLDEVPAYSLQNHITQFWPPEKISSCVAMSEEGSIFSFGLYILWNILLALGTSENDRTTAIEQLQEGTRPTLMSLLEPHICQLILYLCTQKPEDRPLMNNISPMSLSFGRLPTVDVKLPFRLSYDVKELTDQIQSDFTTINRITIPNNKQCVCEGKGCWRFKGNKYNGSIYTVSNRPGVIEKVFGRLRICGHFDAMPRQFVMTTFVHFDFEAGKTIHSPEKVADCMLDINDRGQLIAVPRAHDAVDWVIKQTATLRCIPHPRKYELPYIHTAFPSALHCLVEFHKQGIYHGNINLKTFVMSRYERMGLSNPALVETDTDCFSRATYITLYSSPEQKITLQGSTQSDVFSLGVILYVLLCNYRDVVEVDLNQFQTDQQLHFPRAVPLEFCELIRQMTRIHPEERIDIRQSLQKFDEICDLFLEEENETQSYIEFYKNSYLPSTQREAFLKKHDALRCGETNVKRLNFEDRISTS